MLNLKIILSSTREGRKGPSIANWIYDYAVKHGEFNVELIDLQKVNLPFMDEPNHPKQQRYIHQHTRDWSAMIGPADAFIFVAPEYNYGMPATLKNAIDFLYNEWSYKPVGIVSYGGLSAGTRSAQMLKLVCNAVKMVPLTEGVNLAFFNKNINEQGIFISSELIDKSAEAMMNELHQWAPVLKAKRELAVTKS